MTSPETSPSPRHRDVGKRARGAVAPLKEVDGDSRSVACDGCGLDRYRVSRWRSPTRSTEAISGGHEGSRRDASCSGSAGGRQVRAGNDQSSRYRSRRVPWSEFGTQSRRDRPGANWNHTTRLVQFGPHPRTDRLFGDSRPRRQRPRSWCLLSTPHPRPRGSGGRWVGRRGYRSVHRQHRGDVLENRFPSSARYGSHGSSALQLVTCGGVFDHQTGSYLSNIVVYTSLSAVIEG